MNTQREQRAEALEAIGNALLKLAALERDPGPAERPVREVLINRRNCAAELGLPGRAFLDAAGTEFPAFLVSRRVTAMKADVLAWLKTRRVEPRRPPPAPAPSRIETPTDVDAFLRLVHVRFVERVGRPMTDDELERADMEIDVGRAIASHLKKEWTDSPDDVAARVQGDIGKEQTWVAAWRSFGLDPDEMHRKAEELRQQMYEQHPEYGWRERVQEIHNMWGVITEPLYEAQRVERAAARAARKAEKAERARLGKLGLKR